ncbi:MAG: sterol desaturase family protein [Reichenbachiella sp.]
MSTYAQVLLIAIPFFMVLLIIEFVYGWLTNRQTLKSFDTISSLSSGISNTLKDILGLTLIIVGYQWMYSHIALMKLEDTIGVYLIGFVLVDFAGYTKHYMAHHINYFWNEHVIHHSSEEFNLACALRQSVSVIFSIHAFLLIPAALFGVPPKVIAVIGPLHLFLQFWYHTKHIPKLGFLEYLIVTPSQHRVHHAINPEYLDKNMGQIFPWWDRLFGTFQEELDDVPCVYGIKKPAETWNPFLINFQHLWILMQDAWRTKDWKAKFNIWFKPTGWRPADMIDLYPIEIIDDPYDQVKYDTSAPKSMHVWSWVQLVLTHIFLIHLLFNFDTIGFPNVFVYAGFIFVHIYSYTTLMDLNRVAIFVELIKFSIVVWWVMNTGAWFGMEKLIYQGGYLMIVYAVISLIATVWFSLRPLATQAQQD